MHCSIGGRKPGSCGARIIERVGALIATNVVIPPGRRAAGDVGRVPLASVRLFVRAFIGVMTEEVVSIWRIDGRWLAGFARIVHGVHILGVPRPQHELLGIWRENVSMAADFRHVSIRVIDKGLTLENLS